MDIERVNARMHESKEASANESISLNERSHEAQDEVSALHTFLCNQPFNPISRCAFVVERKAYV